MPKRSAKKSEEWHLLRQSMKEHRLDHYTQPGDLYWDDDFSPAEAKLLTFIAYLDKGTRGCWASNTYLSAFMNCHENTIITAIRHFEERGFIVIEPWDGFERRIHIAPEYRQLFKGEYKNHYPKTGKPVHNDTKILPNNVARLPKKSGLYKDESGKESCKESEASPNGVSRTPKPPRKVDLSTVPQSVIETAKAAITARGVRIKNWDSPAARGTLRDEVARMEEE